MTTEAAIDDKACLTALRLSEKGYTDEQLAKAARCTVDEIRRALKRGEELRAEGASWPS